MLKIIDLYLNSAGEESFAQMLWWRDGVFNPDPAGRRCRLRWGLSGLQRRINLWRAGKPWPMISATCYCPWQIYL